MAKPPSHPILGAFALSLASALGAQAPLIWPGDSIATIDGEHLRAYVPYAQREELRRLVARADQIYARMCADAKFTPSRKLRLLLADFEDDHNGYSFVVPFPLVQVQLAPALAPSTIFAGGDDVERTLIHEFMHQISNDRNSRGRSVLEGIFGRILPNDLLSSLLWYVSTPAHQTMPRFWHEGIAVWAETEYADPQSVWRGRGRDPLTHMQWRLDAAAGAVPAVGDWRVTWHEWPFGARAYSYGTAYTRYLAGALGDRLSVYKFVDQQAKYWAFIFDQAPRRLGQRRHLSLINQARGALLDEQKAILAHLRSVPLTAMERLTPRDTVVGAPAFTPDGDLAYAAQPPDGRARLHFLRADGEIDATWTKTRAIAGMRSTPGGALVYHEFNWRRISRVSLDGRTLGWRMLQPDAVEVGEDAFLLAAIKLRDGGGQDLVVHTVRDGDLGEAQVLPVEGKPWSPVIRRGAREPKELLWVETDKTGSRLVLAPLTAPRERRVLVAVKGRILHPVTTADGGHAYFCADHTGVANAWRVDFAGGPAVPVTHTLGGVVACVPSPDGTTLAVVDHDERGPFLARIAADAQTFPAEVPSIELRWPAPVERAAAPDPAAAPAFSLPPLEPGAEDALQAESYWGLSELRPLFWAPTTFAVPEGGYGVFGLAADPLLTQVVQAGVGVGLVEYEPVASLSWDWLALPVEFGLRLGRSERTYADAIVEDVTLDEFDYTETVERAEFRFGRGLFALEKTLLAHVGVGIEDYDEVDDAAEEYAGRVLINTPPFLGTDQYVEFTLGYADTTFYPASFGFEDGLTLIGVYRHSGFGGDLERNFALGTAGYVWSVLPDINHQVVLGGQVGWSDGDDTLQSNFSIGGGLGRGLPRGYIESAQVTGPYLLAGSLAYRFPVWRPFVGATTTPFRGRQLVVELFGDTAQISTDHIGGDGDWFTSVGAELHVNAEFFDAVINPGLGIAVQLDGDEDVEVYFSLGFYF